MIKAVFFDLDGTLADTIGDVAYVGNKALEEFSLPSIDKELYKHFVGDGAKNLCDRMLVHLGVFDKEKSAELLKTYLALYLKYEGEHISAYDGMKETLVELETQGKKLFVISNKPCVNVKNALKILYGVIDFCEVLGGDSGFALKPATDSLFALMEKYGYKKEEVAYVGDGDADAKLYHAAGVFGISCLWGYRKKSELKQVGATVFAERPSDIVALTK